MADLGTLPGDFSSFAVAINSKAQVVGQSCNMGFSVCRGFLWQNGVMTDLNTLLPTGSSLHLSAAFDINARGQIVGFALTSTGEVHAFLATPSQGEADRESATLGARGETSQSPKVVLPENVRKLLQQGVGPGRYGARLMRPQ